MGFVVVLRTPRQKGTGQGILLTPGTLFRRLFPLLQGRPRDSRLGALEAQGGSSPRSGHCTAETGSSCLSGGGCQPGQ